MSAAFSFYDFFMLLFGYLKCGEIVLLTPLRFKYHNSNITT